MNFTSTQEVKKFQQKLQLLDDNGVQGTCYLETKSNIVYKFFKDWEEEEFDDFTGEQLLQFADVKTKIFIFPIECLYLNGRVIGYTSNYRVGKLLCHTDPLTVNLNSFLEMLKVAIEDIKNITKQGVNIYDIMYNIMLGEQIYVLDTVDYSRRLLDYEILYQQNIKGFNLEIMRFLIDGYFNELIENHEELLKMYKSSGLNISIIDFVTLLKQYISCILGHEIETLNEAQILMNKNEHKCEYKRG